MKSTKESASRLPDDLLNELRGLIAQAEEILGEDAESEAPGDEAVLEALRARCQAARDRLTDAGVRMRRKVKAEAGQADDAIRGNPYQAIAIAAGIGLVLGMWLNRRRD